MRGMATSVFLCLSQYCLAAVSVVVVSCLTGQELVSKGVTDPARVSVGGHSYGAFMAANLVAHCPQLFAAAIARSGECDAASCCKASSTGSCSCCMNAVRL